MKETVEDMLYNKVKVGDEMIFSAGKQVGIYIIEKIRLRQSKYLNEVNVCYFKK